LAFSHYWPLVVTSELVQTIGEELSAKCCPSPLPLNNRSRQSERRGTGP